MHDMLPHVVRVAQLNQDDINGLKENGLSHGVNEGSDGKPMSMDGKINMKMLRELALEDPFEMASILFPHTSGCPMAKKASLERGQSTAIEILWPWSVDQVVRLMNPSAPTPRS